MSVNRGQNVEYFLFRVLSPVSAANAPADDASQTPATILALDHQGTAAVTLATVLTSLSCARTHEDVGDPLILTGVPTIGNH